MEGQAVVRSRRSFHETLRSRNFFLEGNGGNNPNLCFICFVAKNPQTHCRPLSNSYLGLPEAVLAQWFIWFVLIHNKCIMNDNRLLMLPESSCGYCVRKRSTQSRAFPGPSEPPSSRSASWCISMCGFFCFAKSTVLGREKEA